MIEEIIGDLQYLAETQEQWIKIHAAEYLVWSGRGDSVKPIILEEADCHSQTAKYRIGIWRVLAQMESDTVPRSIWEKKILSVFNDSTAPDRLHAIESLSKLKVSAPQTQNILSRDLLNVNLSPFDLYSVWNAAYHVGIGDDTIRLCILKLLERFRKPYRVDAMLLCSYILRYLGGMSHQQCVLFNRLVTSSDTEDIPLYSSLLATTWIIAPDDTMGSDMECVKSALAGLASDVRALPQLLTVLALKGGMLELELAYQCYIDSKCREGENYDADTHAAASYALLAILERCKKKSNEI